MTETLTSRDIYNEHIEEGFQRIVAAEFGRAALKATKLKVPFGVELMTPFTPLHEQRAREQVDMITVTTYNLSGDVRDR